VDKTYTKLCRLSDLGESRPMVAEARGENVLLVRLNGDVFALENRCTHENLPLNGGQIYDGQIQCPHHGARFEIKTGKATQIPGVMELKTYNVKIENDDVLVALS